jgi:hypothetical protein
VVWLQIVCEAGTKAIAPHAGAEQSRAKTSPRYFIRKTPLFTSVWNGTGENKTDCDCSVLRGNEAVKK